MKRILIIQTAFLGDVILATPVVSELKRIFPSAEIDVLVKKEMNRFYKTIPTFVTASRLTRVKASIVQ